METVKIGDSIFIESYKHDGNVHRIWSKALVIDIFDHCYVVVTDKSYVIESDQRRWLTKEPAICFYYDNRWFNVIAMVRKNGIYYYCNIASPSLYDGEALKNIDYDLDLKVYPDYSYTVLDENEYADHARIMAYPPELMAIIEMELRNLILTVERRERPFDFDYINAYLSRYFRLIQEDK